MDSRVPDVSELSEARPEQGSPPDVNVLDRALMSLVRWDGEKLLWGLLLVMALLSRTIGLGDRAMSHDESLHTVYSFQLFDGRGYQHQPMMHGPLKFILNAAMYFLFGVNDWSARIQVALFGLLMVWLVWQMRGWLGRTGAFVSALMFTISPALLFHSRYIRDEVMLCALLVLLVLSMFRYLETRSPKWLIWTAVALAFALLTMEASFIFGALFGIFLVLEVAMKLWAGEWPVAERRVSYRVLASVALPAIGGGVLLLMFKQRTAGLVLAGVGGLVLVLAIVLVVTTWRSRLRAFAEMDLIILLGTLALPFASSLILKLLGWQISQFNNPGQITLAMVWQGALVLVLLFVVSAALGWFWLRKRWLVAAGIFWAIELLFFTTFLTNGQGIGTGLIGSLGYWIDQQEVMRGGQPWYYFYMLVPLYEFLPLFLSVCALVGWAASGFRSRRRATANESRQALDGPAAASPVDVRGQFAAFLVFWVATVWVLFTYVGEKMAWHTVYFATSMSLLGGWWLGRCIDGIDWRAARARGVFWLMGMLALLLIVLRALLPTGADRPFQNATVNGLSTTAGWLLALVFALVLLYFLYDRVVALGWRLSLRVAVVTIAALLAICTAAVAYRFAFVNYDYAVEPMVYAHGTPDIKLALSQIEEISRKTAGDHALKFSYDDDSTWPLEWYFRDYPNKVYYGATPSRDNMDVPVVIVGDKNLAKVRPYLGDRYYEFDYRLIWWPKEGYKDLSWKKLVEGLRDPQKRKQFWDVVLYRRYPDGTAQWDPAHRFRVFVRKDVASQVWDWGAPTAGASAGTETTVDPYAGGQRRIAAVQQLGVTGTSGSAPGQFNFPRAVAVDGEGKIYVADSGNNRVQVFNPDGSFLRQWGTTCKLDTGEGCQSDGRGQFNEPWGIAVDADGNVYVSDTWNHRIQKFDNQGSFLKMWGTFGATGGELGAEGVFYGPRSLAVGQDGNISVVDTGNKRVQVFSPDGVFVTQYGGGGIVDGHLDEPVGLGQDAEGNWYVSDTWNRRIEKFDSGYKYVAQWPIAGWASQSVVNKPALAVDGERGIVYTVDPENYRVLAFKLDGTFLATFGLYGNDNETFTLPTGISVGRDGRVYVADGDSHRIMVFPPLQ